MIHPSIFNWSGGKDSALAIHHVLKNPELRIGKLITSVNSTYNRVSMHGLRTELLQLQADSLGLPLQQLLLADRPTMEAYNLSMAEMMQELKAEEYTSPSSQENSCTSDPEPTPANMGFWFCDLLTEKK